MSTSDYFSLLTSVSRQLSKDDLKHLVFSCGSILPTSSAEKIASGVDLFQELKRRGHLGPANYNYLRKQLVLVGRHDLASMLPDQFEILFGQSSLRDKGLFGCFVSPIPSDTNLVDVSMLKVCHPTTESRIFLMYLSQQLNYEDIKKLSFLMYPTHSQVTTMDLAELLESEGGLSSIDVVNHLSSCLEAVGRVDIAQILNPLKVPSVLMTSLSTSQQQLNLKMRLFLHSKQQSYDFHMKALGILETDSETKIKLIGPIIHCIQESFEKSRILVLTNSLEKAMHDSQVNTTKQIDFDSLIKTSLLEALKVHNAYTMRYDILYSDKVPTEKLCGLSDQFHESCKSFDCLMGSFNWNSEIRDEFKELIKLRRSPFGKPAELACQYIFDLSEEISQHRIMYEEKQKLTRICKR